MREALPGGEEMSGEKTVFIVSQVRQPLRERVYRLPRLFNSLPQALPGDM